MSKGKRGRPKKGCDKKALMESVIEPNVDIDTEEEEFEEEEEDLDEELDFEHHKSYDSEFYHNDDEL